MASGQKSRTLTGTLISLSPHPVLLCSTAATHLALAPDHLHCATHPMRNAFAHDIIRPTIHIQDFVFFSSNTVIQDKSYKFTVIKFYPQVNFKTTSELAGHSKVFDLLLAASQKRIDDWTAPLVGILV